MEKISVEEPKMAFDYLELELARQSRELRIDREELVRSDRYIMTNEKTGGNLTVASFVSRMHYYLKKCIETDYSPSDLFFTSAVYAFKAECDRLSVASIIGYPGAIKMFRNLEKYDLFERKKSRSVNDYFDRLFFE